MCISPVTQFRAFIARAHQRHAAKLGRLVLSQYLRRCEHTHWNTRVQTGVSSVHFLCYEHTLTMALCNDSALVSINEVVQRQARLVLGRVIVSHRRYISTKYENRLPINYVYR